MTTMRSIVRCGILITTIGLGLGQTTVANASDGLEGQAEDVILSCKCIEATGEDAKCSSTERTVNLTEWESLASQTGEKIENGATYEYWAESEGSVLKRRTESKRTGKYGFSTETVETLNRFSGKIDIRWNTYYDSGRTMFLTWVLECGIAKRQF